MSIEPPRNFWKPPTTGYSERDTGLTHAQLNAVEARDGFRLPLQYKALMQMQNGGCLRYSECGGILLENFESLSVTDQDVVTFEDHALITCSQEAIDAWKQAHPFASPSAWWSSWTAW